MLAFKVFGPKRTGRFVPHFTYPRPGVWARATGVSMCSSGYHVSDSFRNLDHYLGDERTSIYLVEVDGECAFNKDDRNKAAFARVKLIKRLDFTKTFLLKTLKTVGLCVLKSDSKRYLLTNLFKKINNKKVLNAVAKHTGISKHILTRSVIDVLQRRKSKASIV